MFPLRPALRAYSWGSTSAIPDLFGIPTTGAPVAEAWLGAHPTGPASIVGGAAGATDLASLIAADPVRALGEDVVARFGPQLPYLLKVIAVERPLSLQVHPDRASARRGFAAEDAAGIPRDAAHRNYRDSNHKPELVVALTTFHSMSGFRAPRRAAELLEGLGTSLTKTLLEILTADLTADGVRTVFHRLLDPGTRPSAAEFDEVGRACRARLAAGSPSPRADRTAVDLSEAYPGDPGVVVSLLLNPVTLQPGEAMFIPAGGVHAYLSGVGLEIMANSDNVLRAGLTDKHVDVPELLANVDYIAAPPVRIAPEGAGAATRVYYAPVDDFEVSLTTVDGPEPVRVPGRGPRVLLCVDGSTRVHADDALDLAAGQSAFVPADAGSLTISGHGRLVQAAVP